MNTENKHEFTCLFAFVNKLEKKEEKAIFLFFYLISYIEYPSDCLGSKKWIKTDHASVIRRRCWDV